MKRISVYVPVALIFFVVGSMAMSLWSGAFAQGADKAKVVAANPKWEYKVVSENTQPVIGLNTKSIESSLNRLGEEGWECVGTVGEVKGGSAEANMTNAVLIFKRPKK